MVPVTLEQRPESPVEAQGTGAVGVGTAPDERKARREHAARDDVLARMRHRSGQRPRFDPGLAGGLRAWLEDGASALVASRGDDAPPISLGPRLLLAQAGTPALPLEDRGNPYPAPFVISCLVRALFRQLVLTGSVGDPLSDALDALSLHPDRVGMARHVADLDGAARAALAAEVTTQVGHLRDLTPHFAPGWFPRTDDRVAIPLAGGRVVLCGVFDLLVGAPVDGRASVCAVALTSGGPWAFARTALHYLALLETLRSGSPPFRLALLDSTVGRYVVEDVREEHLCAMVSHVVTRLSTVPPNHAD